MGRYYEGDINGKFWFGIQPSTAPSRFGVDYTEPSYVDYNFEQDDLPSVVAEIANIEETVGLDNIQLLDNFFAEVTRYDDEAMDKYHQGLSDIWKQHASDYADLTLGRQIRDCIQEAGYCSFTAEL